MSVNFEKMNTFYPDGCGICEKDGGETWFFAPYQPHGECFKAIEGPQNGLYQKANELFKEKVYIKNKNEALIYAFEAVRRACGEHTILSYLHENKIDALTKLFNTVGISALEKYAKENSL